VAQAAALVKQPEARVYPWYELLPEVVQMNAMFKGSLLLVMTVVFVIIAVVVMNTVLMTVLERTREFGTMLSLGSSPGLIVRLVLLESVAVSVVGSAIGLGFGSLAAWAHSLTGMSMKAHGLAAIPGTTDVVFPHLTFAATVQPALAMPLMVLLVSLYPAWRASRLQPVAAMRAV
jgi:ABC-type lipoprotein release transport system permease subunit